MPEKKLNRIVIRIKDGAIEAIYSDKIVEIHAYDFDVFQNGDTNCPSIYNSFQLTKKALKKLDDEVKEEIKMADDPDDDECD